MVSIDTSVHEQALRQATAYRPFVAVCRDIVKSSNHVRIDKGAVEAYAASLRVPDYIPCWGEYLTPRNKSIWARTHDFIELAINVSINAGYLYRASDGATAKWELDGSGAAALRAKMDVVRNMGALPGLQLKTPDAVVERLSPVFNGVPFADLRLQIWQGFAGKKPVSALRDLLYSTRRTVGAKQHHFTFDHLKALAEINPVGFGEDPFLKKAALLPILFAGVAHNKIMPGSVTMEPFCVADYRVPQTDHNIGLLRMSDELIARLDAGELMHQSDPMVTDIRASSWVINDMILNLRPDIQPYHIDGEKWFAGRLFDRPVELLKDSHRAIRHTLEKIGCESGFSEKGFVRKAKKPMSVQTMRF